MRNNVLGCSRGDRHPFRLLCLSARSPDGGLQEANARLIASAPDLLEALREARRAIGEHSAPNDCYATGPLTGNAHRDLVECPACRFIAMHDAAIAKAKGTQTGQAAHGYTYSGNRYTVICVANEGAKYPEKFPVLVIYRGEFDRIWSRPLSEFLDNFIEVDAKGRKTKTWGQPRPRQRIRPSK